MFGTVVFRTFFVLYDHRSRAYPYFIYGMPRLSRALLMVSTGTYGGVSRTFLPCFDNGMNHGTSIYGSLPVVPC